MKRERRRLGMSISSPLCVFVDVRNGLRDTLPSTWGRASRHWVVGDGLIAVPLDWCRFGLRGGVNLSTLDIQDALLPFSGGSLMLSTFPTGIRGFGAMPGEPVSF